MVDYVELQTVSNFSFLHGASHSDELIWAASAKGLSGLALCDRNSFAGTVRAHVAAKEHNLPFIPGLHLDLKDAPSLLCYPTDRAAYGRLCHLLTIGKRRAEKGDIELYLSDLSDFAEGSLFIALQPRRPVDGFMEELKCLKEKLDGSLWMAVSRHLDGFDQDRIDFAKQVESQLDLPIVATNDVHMHTRNRKALQDVLVCIREHCRLETAGYRLFPNAERTLKSPDEMAALFPDTPHWLSASCDIANACTFSFDELKYEYPDEGAEEGENSQERLIRLTWEGAKKRYPDGLPEKVEKGLHHELDLIGRLNYAPYFLTVYDIVSFARSQNILCQGRGSAANSSVCYCLFITEVAPDRIDLLFERFVSAARDEPPDIDVDFEHERREEVIQYIYQRYGRDRAGLTATVITYRSRSAIREVGKVFGLHDDTLTRMAKTIWGWGTSGIREDQVREAGLSPDDERIRAVMEISAELIGFPRHLSQHVGGFVITRGPLHELSPIANAAMEGRTTIEWNKDDIEALGILKIDVLALGMLSCIRKSFDLLRDHKNIDLNLQTLPKEDPAVYHMLQKADAIGVFQVESRAQLSMLPRLKPKEFYDLVVEVAIVRPGPIQGDMVHPYLRRRMGKEKVDYPSKELEDVLKRTYGVPLFQEQAMQVAIVGAGFTPEEADRLRRDMASFRRIGQVQKHREKFLKGMLAKGYAEEFAERCFQQIEGFADYGFPESHAASFANLVYVSSWLKCHHPDIFACALLNSQPMGFYAPAQLIRDARQHHVKVLPVDINHSYWDNHMEREALRLGFRQVKGVGELDALTLISKRPEYGFSDLTLLARQTRLSPRVLEKLADADAFASLGLSRRDALWAIRRLGQGHKQAAPLPLFEVLENDHNIGTPAEYGTEETVVLPEMSVGEEVIEDYASLRLSLKAHPLLLLRDRLTQAGVCPSKDLVNVPNNKKATVAGLIIARQRPGTASGVVFMTLEDETDIANIIVWPKVFEEHRRILMSSTLLAVRGKVQCEDGVIHVIAEELLDLSGLLQELSQDTVIQSRTRRHPRNISWSVTPQRKSIHELAEESQDKDAPFSVDSRDFH
ncbi:error-prone DNA polymerase [Terasakiella sp. A23]|uniref:error-prone DNA polymerase n=1 Tax=Terasakiella sp. FCG-A23 TaxID=3080561 RepID=UPI0029539640|nr:error-prone DNA polymerase [Terasakiella sp. A23]MDV7341258.1 error-prone DNA polymerase [Terasakiella sp. A23]